MTHAIALDRTDCLDAPIETSGPVLVALKPFGGGDSAVTTARWIAERRHAELHAISVIEMGDMGTAVAGLPPLPEEYYQRERDELASDLRSRLTRAGAEVRGRVDVVDGPPGSTVAAAAAACAASAIVIGTGRHGMLGRFLYGERALDVVRSADRTVLVVPPYAEPPIQRAIVAVDVSQASVRAARAALDLLDAGGRLTLVHVESVARQIDGRPLEQEREREQRTRALFARFLDALSGTTDFLLDTVILRGDAVGALLRYAEEHEADLIACGRRRRSIVERLLVGSVSTSLIRGAPCCVLVAPERVDDLDAGANLAFVSSPLPLARSGLPRPSGG